MEIGPAQFSACRDPICAVQGFCSLRKLLFKRVPETKGCDGVCYSHAGAQLNPVCSHCCLVTGQSHSLRAATDSGWLFSSFDQC